MARLNKLKAFAKSSGAVKLVAGAETVVATLNGIVTDNTNTQVIINAEVLFTSAAESVEQTIRVRRGGLTGSVVATVTVKEGASKKCTVSLLEEDQPGEVAQQAYVLTVQDVAGKETEVTKAQIEASF